MIEIKDTKICGWEEAIRGMRNPMNSWDRSDSEILNDIVNIGKNDYELMLKLAMNGPVHAKYKRMIVVYADITAPLYFWKEFDTYKVGTVANSCSTMHKIADKRFTLDDFSCEHLLCDEPFNVKKTEESQVSIPMASIDILHLTVNFLNGYRELYLKTKDKKYWWQMIQLLPSSYNQKRTVMLNYEVLTNIYIYRNNHKLDEWKYLCNKWIVNLPYSEIITCGGKS